MSDVIQVLKDIRNKIFTELPGQKREIEICGLIEEALKDPELRIEVPKGELVVGVSNIDPESRQAYICLDTKDVGLIDLALVECVEESLRKEGEKEGDIRLRLWGDIRNEDYTYASEITASEIDELEESLKEREKD